MKREFLINLLFLLFINLLIKPFYVLGIDVAVQNTVGPEEYGLFFSLFNFCYLFQVFADFGIQNYNNRKISQKRYLVYNLTSYILSLKLILSLLFFLLIVLFALFLGYPFDYFPILFWIAINQVLLSYSLYLRSNVSGMGHYRWDSIFSVLDKLILIFVLGYLLWLAPLRSDFNIWWFIWAQTGSLVCSLSFLFVFHLKKAWFTRIRFSVPIFKKIINESWPFASVVILMTAYTRLDAVMLERMLDEGTRASGIYAAGYRLLDAANMVGFLFAGLLLPMFSRMISQKIEVYQLLSLSIRLMFVLSLILGFFCFYESNSIMAFLYPKYQNLSYGRVMGVLMLSFIPVSLSYILGTLLTAGGHIRNMNKIFLAGLILNFGLNFILIPGHFAYGAAISTFITQAFVLISQFILVKTIYKFKISSKGLFASICFGFSVPGIFYVLSNWFSLHWFIVFVCGTAVSILVSLLLNTIEYRKLFLVLLKVQHKKEYP